MREDRAVMDVFSCARHHTSLDGAGRLLAANEERSLRSPSAMRALFGDMPEALAGTERLAERLEFSLEDPGYEFPAYPVPAGETAESFLRKVTMAGARSRYGHLGRAHHRQHALRERRRGREPLGDARWLRCDAHTRSGLRLGYGRHRA